jgi:hypothetical protein
MSKIKSLADQLREQMAIPAVSPLDMSSRVEPPKSRAIKTLDPLPDIVEQIKGYDSSGNKSMVHVKLDAHTAKLLGHFKMATGVDNIKLGAFAIRYLFDTHPELKTYIKNFIQNLEL